MNGKKLEGKISLVTGGSRGIGGAIALSLAKVGSHVIVNYNNSTELADLLIEDIKKMHVDAISVKANISEKKGVDQLFMEIKQKFGGLDILVNNAGIAKPQSLDKITLQDWYEVINTNLTSAFLVTQAAIPSMMEKRFGRIINISSVAAQLGGVVGPHYAASKAGMHGLTHYYASNLASYGITVNSVAPALIETDMIKNNPRIKSALIPVGRFGLPQEVADAVLLLATSGYITGQTLNVNGGWYMS